MASNKQPAPFGYGNKEITFHNIKQKLDTVSLDLGNGSKIEMIQYEKLVPFPNNRDIDDTDIDVFAENIKRNGFQTAIVIAREFDGGETRTGHPTGKYIIISGHRRYAAFGMILEQDSSFMHRKIPALILRDDIPWTELEELNLLMNYDAVSESSHPGDMRIRVARLMELLQKRGIEKKIYDRIADKLSISSRQIRKYDSINKNLIVGLQNLLDEEKITINQANQYASRSIDVQNYILKYINEHNETITEDEYQQLKSQDEENQKAQKLAEERLRESAQKLKEQEAEIARLKNKTIELESMVHDEEDNSETASQELINTQAQLRRAREKADKYQKILKDAKEADAEQLNKTIGISAPIAVNEMLSKINDNVVKLGKRKEKRGYQFTKNDIQKIKAIIDDLKALIDEK
ncbi:MAG: ParB N-terminal domain-containing protein [Butyrivibrio sp.]|nr:ParB N-terminal domain-containing protein [Butyrivibrio sp.]